MGPPIWDAGGNGQGSLKHGEVWRGATGLRGFDREYPETHFDGYLQV
jgi:hypothetical protein